MVLLENFEKIGSRYKNPLNGTKYGMVVSKFNEFLVMVMRHKFLMLLCDYSEVVFSCFRLKLGNNPAKRLH